MSRFDDSESSVDSEEEIVVHHNRVKLDNLSAKDLMRNYQCLQCQKVFPFDFQLEKHRLEHRGNQDIKREVKEETESESESESKLNLNSESELKSESESETESKSETPEPPKKKLKTPKKKLNTENQNLQCLQCPKFYINKHKLRRHVYSVHLNKARICDECGSVFPTAKICNQHKKKHIVRYTFKCRLPDCSAAFRDNKGLTSHKRRHHVINQCSICNFRFKTPEKLKLHTTAHREDGLLIFECDLCSKIQKTEEYLRKHKFRRHGVFTCGICDFTSYEHNEIENHKQSHIPEKTIKCPECDKLFAGKQGLKLHISVHHIKGDSRPTFVCDVCDKVIFDKHALQKHKTMHLPTEYICIGCCRKFQSADDLKAHKQRNDHGKGLKCPICSDKFQLPCLLEIHTKECSSGKFLRGS